MKRKGFTLAELLVVIAIIALLMAIIVTAMQNAKRQAKTVLCGSHIRQLLLGLLIYETENQSFPFSLDNTTPWNPPPGGLPGNPSYDRMGWWWFNYIAEYSRKSTRKNNVLFCPSKNLTGLALNWNVLCGNYGVNQFICKSAVGHKRQTKAGFTGTPLSAIDLQQPGRTLLIADSGYSLINWWHVTEPPPAELDTLREDTVYMPGLKINKKKTDFLQDGQKNDAIEGRHRNKTVNVGFADGHVNCIKADELLVEEQPDGTYKNRSPLWIPK